MRIHSSLRFSLVIFAGLLLLGLSLSSDGMLKPAAQHNTGSSDVPVLDYEAEIRKTVGKERKEKNSRFNARGNPDKTKHISELPEGVEPLPTNSHWWVGLTALPVNQSAAVVLGEVTGAGAHLSNDKTGIYSEFIVRLEEVFKDTTNSLNVGGTLSVNRDGGGVRFASGKVQKYTIRGQRMPREGQRYVLFVKQTERGDFLILTGYEVTGDRVKPLDGEDSNDPRSSLPFVQYKGAHRLRLLQDLRTAVRAELSGRGR
jgi:hypothetical protein